MDKLSTSSATFIKRGGNSKPSNVSIYDKSQKEIAMKRALETFASSTSRAILNADCIIWLVPLFAVQYYEAAFSQDVLKYRSIAGQYLAKQPGGQHSLRIDAKLQGPSASRYLSLLQYLYIKGSKSEEINKGLKDMFTGPAGTTILGNLIGSGEMFSAATNKVKELDVIKQDMDTTKEDLVEISKNDFKWMRSNYHKTFNVTTKEFVIFDVYIESLIYWQDLDTTDRDTINVSILFHKFIEPPYITDVFIGKAIEEDTRSFETALNEEIKANSYVESEKPLSTAPPLLPQDKMNAYAKNSWKALTAMNLSDSPQLYTRANMKRSYIRTKKLDTQANNYTDLHLNLINIASTGIITNMFQMVGQKPNDYNLQNRNIRNMGLYGFIMNLNYASVWPKITNKIFNSKPPKKPQFSTAGTLIINQMTRIGSTTIVKPKLNDWETGLQNIIRGELYYNNFTKEMTVNDIIFVFKNNNIRVEITVKKKDGTLLLGPFPFDVTSDLNCYFMDNSGLYYILCFRRYDIITQSVYIVTYNGAVEVV